MEEGQSLAKDLRFMVLLNAQPLTGMNLSQPAFQCTSNLIGTEEVGGTHIQAEALRFTDPAAAFHSVRAACLGHSLRHLVPSAPAYDLFSAAVRHSVPAAARGRVPAPPAGGSRRAAAPPLRTRDQPRRRACASPVRRSRP